MDEDLGLIGVLRLLLAAKAREPEQHTVAARAAQHGEEAGGRHHDDGHAEAQHQKCRQPRVGVHVPQLDLDRGGRANSRWNAD